MVTRGLKVSLAAAGFLALLPATQVSAADLNLSAGTTAGACAAAGAGTVVSGGVTYCSFQGALWTTTDNQSTGTGVIQPFVRIHDNDGTESGMNTNGNLTQNENSSPNFTRDLLEGSVPIVSIGGQDYYEFLLDINQEGSDPILSLQGFELCYSATGSQTILANATDCAGTDLYSLDNYPATDGAVNNTISVSTDFGSGSGSGDLFAYIPVLVNVPNSNFLYLWSQFGPTPYPQNDGFEEWAIRSLTTPGGSPIPEPASLLLLGGGLSGLSAYARRLRQRKAQKSA